MQINWKWFHFWVILRYNFEAFSLIVWLKRVFSVFWSWCVIDRDRNVLNWMKNFFNYFSEKNHIYTPLSRIQQCFNICIWFPRHVFEDMVLFSALVFWANRILLKFHGNQEILKFYIILDILAITWVTWDHIAFWS